MIALNIFVFVAYLALLLTLFLFFKYANLSHNTQQQNKIKNINDVNKSVTYKQSKWITFSKYFFFRFTPLAITLHNKKYSITQLFTSSLYALTLLKLNRINIINLAYAPLFFLISFVIAQGLQLYQTWASRYQQKQYDQCTSSNISQNRQISVASEPVLKLESILWSIFVLFAAISFIGCGFRILQSLSNLGLLHLESLLIIISIDLLLVRPIQFLLIIGVIFAVQKITGTIIQKNIYLKQLLIRQYIRTNQYQIIIIPATSSLSFSSKKSNNQITNKQISNLQLHISPPKQFLKQDDRNNYKSNDELTLIDLLKQKQNQSRGQWECMKMEDICLNDDDKTYKDQNSQISIPITPIVQTQNQLNDDTSNKQNYHDQILRHNYKKQQLNQDIYLAENLFVTKNQQTLPVTLTLSPPKQKIKVKQKRNNKRLLLMSGNSPYLQYLPNMLKKQQSQGKFRHHSKQNYQKGGFIPQTKTDTIKGNKLNGSININGSVLREFRK